MAGWFTSAVCLPFCKEQNQAKKSKGQLQRRSSFLVIKHDAEEVYTAADAKGSQVNGYAGTEHEAGSLKDCVGNHESPQRIHEPDAG